MFSTIGQIQRANEAAGNHFFEPATLRFFRSRVGADIFAGRYFVTSEKRTGFRSADGPRLYTVRCADADGSIDTVGEFQAYPTRRAAIAAIKRIIAAGGAS